MSVKSAGRVLKILEHFAATSAPASLTELAEALDLPKSSCLALIETLEQGGYLYQVHPRVGYYPTGKWLEQAQVIAEHDPVVRRVTPFMVTLRSRTGETVILGKRVGNRVMYIAVVESEQTVRYTARPGEFKPLYGTASGKALLARLTAAERRDVLRALPLKRFTPTTIASIGGIERDLERAGARGWYCTIAEHVPDVTAIAAVVTLNDDYVLVVAGPNHRLRGRLDATGSAVVETCREIEMATNTAKVGQGRK